MHRHFDESTRRETLNAQNILLHKSKKLSNMVLSQAVNKQIHQQSIMAGKDKAL